MKIIMVEMWLAVSIMVTFSSIAEGQYGGPQLRRECFTNIDETITISVVAEPIIWRDTALPIVNEYRELHGSAKLDYNIQLCSTLITRSHMLRDLTSLDRTAIMTLTPGVINCGENLYISSNTTLPMGKEVIDSWYAQSKDYDYEKGQPKTPTDRVDDFTQLVWNATSEMCLGYVLSGDTTRWVAVALFWPIGNIPGQYLENIKEIPLVVKPTTEKPKPKPIPRKAKKCASVMHLPSHIWIILFLVMPIAMAVHK